MTQSFSFPKTARVLDSATYAVALKSKPVRRTSHFVLHRSVRPEAEAPRLGLVVPKRMEKKAVRRNALKRVMREVFRLASPSLTTADWVVRVVAPFQETGVRSLKKAARLEVERLLAPAKPPAAP